MWAPVWLKKIQIDWRPYGKFIHLTNISYCIQPIPCQNNIRTYRLSTKTLAHKEWKTSWSRRFRQNDDTQQRKCHSWYPELFLDYKPNIYLSKTLWMLDNNPVTLSGTGCHCFNKKEIKKHFYGKFICLRFWEIKYEVLNAG